MAHSDRAKAHWSQPSMAAALPDGRFATIDTDATGQPQLRVWELAFSALAHSLAGWQRMVGAGADGPLRVERTRHSGLDVSGPKHGLNAIRQLSHRIRKSGS